MYLTSINHATHLINYVTFIDRKLPNFARLTMNENISIDNIVISGLHIRLCPAGCNRKGFAETVPQYGGLCKEERHYLYGL